MPEQFLFGTWKLFQISMLSLRAHHLPEPAVEVAREVLGEKFLKLPFHQIVCIGAVVAEREMECGGSRPSARLTVIG